MKKTIRFLLITLLLVISSLSMYAQIIPNDSLYLGQTPPRNTTKVFKLQVSANSFAAKRIAISNDGKNIYYQELDGYTELDGKPHTQRMKYFSFSDGKWNRPFTLFENLFCPSLSINENKMFLQKGVKEAFYCIKTENGWSIPKRFLTHLKITHNLQETNSGNFYITSYPDNNVGGLDRSRMFINGTDTTVSSFGYPLNTVGHDFDFFISPDESFMLVTTNQGLAVSFPKKDGNWTNPKNLGKVINFGLNEWGPYVTKDKKYLFYTAGTKPDYSDTYIYWVSLGNIIDSLKHTNYVPYLKNKISDKTIAPETEVNFAIPNDTFIDDDGNHTLTYSAVLEDGKALPTWLKFSEKQLIFSGTPPTEGIIKIKIRATDNAGESVSCSFELNVKSENKK